MIDTTLDHAHAKSHTGSVSGLVSLAHVVGRLPSAVHPVHLTLAGCALCVLAGVLAAEGASVGIVAVLFAAGSCLDALDGALARHRGVSSTAGAFVDALADKIGEVALLLGLSFRYADPLLLRLVAVAVATGMLTSFVKAAAGEYKVCTAWPEVRLWGRGLRVTILIVGLTFAAVPRYEHTAVVSTLLVLLAFNIAAFVSRTLKTARALGFEQPTSSPDSEFGIWGRTKPTCRLRGLRGTRC